MSQYDWTTAAEDLRACSQCFDDDFNRIHAERERGVHTDWDDAGWTVMPRALKHFKAGRRPDHSSCSLLELPRLVAECAKNAIHHPRHDVHLQTAAEAINLAADMFTLNSSPVSMDFVQRMKVVEIAKSSRLLHMLSYSVARNGEARKALTEAANVRGSEEAAEAAAAVVSKGRQRLKLQFGVAALRLFNTINSIWPGDAGLLASQEYYWVQGAIDCAAMAVQATAAVAAQQTDTAHVAAAEAASMATATAVQLIQQLHSRPQLYTVGDNGHYRLWYFGASAPLLQLALLVADVQLQHVLLSQEPAAAKEGQHSSCSERAYQRFHSQLIKSFGSPPEWLWHQIQQEVLGAPNTSFRWTLDILEQLLQRIENYYGGQRYAKASEALYGVDPAEKAVLSALAPLVPVLLQLADNELTQQPQEQGMSVAATALGAAKHAAAVTDCIMQLSKKDSSLCTTVKLAKVKHIEPYLLSLLRAIVGQAGSFAQGQDNSEGSANSSSSSSGGGCGNSSSTSKSDQLAAYMQLVPPALDVLAGVASANKVAASGTKPHAAACMPWGQQLRSLVPLIEHCIRAGAYADAAAAAAGHKGLVKGLFEALDHLLIAGGASQGFRDWLHLLHPTMWQERSDGDSDSSSLTSSDSDSDDDDANDEQQLQAAEALVAAGSLAAVPQFPTADHDDGSMNNNSTSSKQLVALLVSALKFDDRTSPAEADICCTMLSRSASLLKAAATDDSAAPGSTAFLGQLQQQLAADKPWLVLLARSVMQLAASDERGMQLKGEQRNPTDDFWREVAGRGQEAGFCNWEPLLAMFNNLVDCCKSYTVTVEAATDTSKTSAASKAAIPMHQQLVQLVQQWECDLTLKVQRTQDIISFVKEIRDVETPNDLEQQQQKLQELRSSFRVSASNPADSPYSKETWVLADDLLRADSSWDRLHIMEKSFVWQLLEQLQEAASQLCAVLPLALCCNNPACRNMSNSSELSIVPRRVKGCVCTGCGEARYCGRQCQTLHWPAHRRLCKLLKRPTTSTAT